MDLQAQIVKSEVLWALGERAKAVDQLDKAEVGIGRHASVPLRLRLAETHLRVNGPSQLQAWRNAESLLARLPSYGRAWRLYALAIEAEPTRARQLSDQLHIERDRISQLLPADLREVFAASLPQSPVEPRTTND